MDNYRPISILPTTSKFLEKAVHAQLYDYLIISQHKILSPYQCGFRKAHSTGTAALSFADTIRKNIDQGLMTGAVFIDFQKAFDSIDHSVLLHKLSVLGVLDREHEWFVNYLSARTRDQVVRFQGLLSESEPIVTGVPQGSIIGPLLFVIHVNDLPDIVRHCSILMYAYYTVLFFSGVTASIIENNFNAELELVGLWLINNSLFLNITKTESVLFGTHLILSFRRFQILLYYSMVAPLSVNEFKYLGIVFDECISWNCHIQYTI